MVVLFFLIIEEFNLLSLRVIIVLCCFGLWLIGDLVKVILIWVIIIFFFMLS